MGHAPIEHLADRKAKFAGISRIAGKIDSLVRIALPVEQHRIEAAIEINALEIFILQNRIIALFQGKTETVLERGWKNRIAEVDFREHMTAPISGCLALKKRKKRFSIEPQRYFRTCPFEKGRRDIDRFREGAHPSARRGAIARIADDERDFQSPLIRAILAPHEMIPEYLAMIGRQHDQRVIVLTGCPEIFQETAEYGRPPRLQGRDRPRAVHPHPDPVEVPVEADINSRVRRVCEEAAKKDAPFSARRPARDGLAAARRRGNTSCYKALVRQRADGAIYKRPSQTSLALCAPIAPRWCGSSKKPYRCLRPDKGRDRIWLAASRRETQPAGKYSYALSEGYSLSP